MVERWTGVEVRLLRDALRMSVREFAVHSGLSVSSIAAIESRGSGAKLRPSTQRLLDQVLERASRSAQERFRRGLSDSSFRLGNDAPADRRTVMKLLASGLGAAAVSQFLGLEPAKSAPGTAEYLALSEGLASIYRSGDPQAVWPVAAAFADEVLDWYGGQVEPLPRSPAWWLEFTAS